MLPLHVGNLEKCVGIIPAKMRMCCEDMKCTISIEYSCMYNTVGKKFY